MFSWLTVIIINVLTFSEVFMHAFKNTWLCICIHFQLHYKLVYSHSQPYSQNVHVYVFAIEYFKFVLRAHIFFDIMYFF